MDVFATYGTDEALEVDGAWVDVGDARFLIARSGNPNYAKKFTKLYERNRRALERKDDAADKLSEAIMIEVMAETVLLGWENVTYENQPFNYSVGNAKALLAIKDFRREVMRCSEDFESFRIKTQEEDAGNSLSA